MFAKLSAVSLLALLAFSACSEQSIDRTLENDGVAGSIAENGAAAASSANDGVALKPRWRAVTDVVGTGNKASDPFSIDAPNWRIAWKTKPVDNREEFMIFLYDDDTEEQYIITQSAENDVVEMEGSGVFHLEVVASQPYEIEVKEYK